MTQNHPLPEALSSNKAVARLLSRHAALEAELADLHASPMVDWDGVKLAKRRKLEVAEKIELLRRQYQ